MKFEELNLMPGLIEAIGFEDTTKIQELVIPKILAGANLIGQAPTGTGKTLAYLLPIFQQIDMSSNNIQALILAPTYELVMQTAKTAQTLWKDLSWQLERHESTKVNYSEIKTLGLIGGANINRQIDALKKKPQIIVGSAGRIIELSRKNKLHLSHLKTLVLDEFDRLLDDQNFDNVKAVLKLLPKDIQYLMFSATAPKKALTRAEIFGAIEHIKVDEDKRFAAGCEHLYFCADYRGKITAVRKLARRLTINRGLVFINKTFEVGVALEKLRHDGLKVESLVGTDDKMKRKQAIEKFKSGKCQLLLSTDIAARGLDIADIDYVINVDFPENARVYLHRAGRTARAGATGKVITLAAHNEVNKLFDLEKSLNIQFIEI